MHICNINMHMYITSAHGHELSRCGVFMNTPIMKSTKVQTLGGYGSCLVCVSVRTHYSGIFGLKTPLHAYVLGQHTSMKNEL